MTTPLILEWVNSVNISLPVEDQYGFSIPIEDLYGFTLPLEDLFLNELQSYNYGSEDPNIWIPQYDTTEIVQGRTVGISTFHSPTNDHILSCKTNFNLPSYEDTMRGSVITQPQQRIIDDPDNYTSLNEYPDYISVTKFPVYLREMALEQWKIIATVAIENGITTPEILRSFDAILIQHPADAYMYRFMIQVPYTRGGVYHFFDTPILHQFCEYIEF